MWESLTEQQQIDFVGRFAGVAVTSLDSNSLFLTETYLSTDQLKKYVDYCTAEVSAMTYATHQHNAPETVFFYYYNMMHLDPRIRAKMLWHVLNGVEP